MWHLTPQKKKKKKKTLRDEEKNENVTEKSCQGNMFLQSSSASEKKK